MKAKELEKLADALALAGWEIVELRRAVSREVIQGAVQETRDGGLEIQIRELASE